MDRGNVANGGGSKGRDKCRKTNRQESQTQVNRDGNSKKRNGRTKSVTLFPFKLAYCWMFNKIVMDVGVKSVHVQPNEYAYHNKTYCMHIYRKKKEGETYSYSMINYFNIFFFIFSIQIVFALSTYQIYFLFQKKFRNRKYNRHNKAL